MQIAEKLAKLTALEDTLFNYKEANIVPQPFSSSLFFWSNGAIYRRGIRGIYDLTFSILSLSLFLSVFSLNFYLSVPPYFWIAAFCVASSLLLLLLLAHFMRIWNSTYAQKALSVDRKQIRTFRQRQPKIVLDSGFVYLSVVITSVTFFPREFSVRAHSNKSIFMRQLSKHVTNNVKTLYISNTQLIW